MKKSDHRGMSTTVVHAGEIRTNEYGAVTTPIVQSSTFILRNADEIRQLKAGAKEAVSIMGRWRPRMSRSSPNE
jgi:cystathionine gamma-synthase